MPIIVLFPELPNMPEYADAIRQRVWLDDTTGFVLTSYDAIEERYPSMLLFRCQADGIYRARTEARIYEPLSMKRHVLPGLQKVGPQINKDFKWFLRSWQMTATLEPDEVRFQFDALLAWLTAP